MIQITNQKKGKIHDFPSRFIINTSLAYLTELRLILSFRVPELVDFFLQKTNKQTNKQNKTLT
jgi:hypothetical protein